MTFTLDSSQAVHALSPWIYGYNAASAASAPPGVTLLRAGGNRFTAYNWETNASNAGSDYYYHNDNYLSSSSAAGAAVTPVIDSAQAAGGAALIAVPMLGFVSSNENQLDECGMNASGQCTVPISQNFIPSVPRKGTPFTDPPAPDGHVYQDEFVHFLATKYPAGFAAGPPIFLSLDNEPDLWSSTHAEIERTQTTYASLLGRTLALTRALKAVAPNALTFGPVSYGLFGYMTLQNAPDRDTANPAKDWFLDYYLRQLAAAQATDGHRLLDVLDLHWYSSATGGGVGVTGTSNASAVQAARVQAPRSLWDIGYVESSWITRDIFADYTRSPPSPGPVELLPRLRQKIAADYPGTALAFTEYSHGGGNDITGAVAESDTLGIFGRDGVFAAAYWPLGADERFSSSAFRSFRDYDDAGGHFGNTSFAAASSDDSKASVYASLDAGAPGRVVIVVVNKLNQTITAGLGLRHSQALATGHLYQVTAGSPYDPPTKSVVPQAAGTVSMAAGAVQLALPAWSVTTLVLTP